MNKLEAITVVREFLKDYFKTENVVFWESNELELVFSTLFEVDGKKVFVHYIPTLSITAHISVLENGKMNPIKYDDEIAKLELNLMQLERVIS